MAVTLAQAKNFTQDKLSLSIIDEFRKDQLMDLMLFDNCVSPQGGSSLTYVYNRVTTLPTAGFRAINSEYESAEAASTQLTVSLKVFGGSFKVDRVIQKHVKGIIDQITFQMKQKVAAASALFSDTFINGDSGVSAIAFDGLDVAVTGSSTEVIPAAAIDLSTDAALESNWKKFLYQMRLWKAKLDGNPSAYLVNRDMFAIIQSIADRSTQFNTAKNEFGSEVTFWGQTPFIVVGDKPGTSNPIIPIDGVSGETSIYAIRIGLDGVHCVSPDGTSVVETYLPNLMLPGAVKTGEVEMVTAMALKATRAAGSLRKIKIA